MNPISSYVAKKFTWEFWKRIRKDIDDNPILNMPISTFEYEKIRVSLETAIEAWRELPKKHAKICQKLAWNTGLSGFNVFIKSFVALRDYQ